jgi:hypothetical protein
MKIFCCSLILLVTLLACQQRGTGDKATADDTIKAVPFVSKDTPPTSKDAVFTLLDQGKNSNYQALTTTPVINSIHWRDAAGEQVILLCEPREQKKINGDGMEVWSKRITATCLMRAGEEWEVIWDVKDGIEDCELDMTAAFFANALTVTDVDKNDTAEVTMLYKLGCRGDVGPDTKKLILYEGTTKYAIRGETQIEISASKEKYGGGKKADAALLNGKPALLAFANAQWEKFGKDKF